MTSQPRALFAATERALAAAESLLSVGRARLIASVAPSGVVEPERFTTEQFAGHALAWMASYVEALRQIRNWAVQLAERGENAFGRTGIEDPTLEMVRDQVRRFAEREVAPYAQEWHRRDQLIPLPVIQELAGIGVFGMTVPEEYGGLGLGKTAMSIVSEELSRAYIGVGSLGTRSEIAGELIRLNGTDAQKARWLPSIA